MEAGLTYADAGVNINKANKLVKKIKEIANKTPRSGVMGEIGGFGGLFSLNTSNLEKPVLVSATDGVGTKLKIAIQMDKHDTIGIDLVAMCVNDIAVQGAKPLFFLDYLSMGNLVTETATDIIKGIAEGCRQADCALIGGETAEMPGLYQDKEYDLAGFSVGIVDNSKIVDGSEIHNGHKIIGLASSGLHSNGYSLVRKICFDHLNLKIDQQIPVLGKTLGAELLTPTKIYSKIVQQLLRNFPIHGFAHITGGGLEENIIRIVPEACQVMIQKNSWDTPPIFNFLQENGKISDAEMMRTFNNGIGFAIITPANYVQDILEQLAAMDEKAYVIGDISGRKKTDARIKWT